MEKTVDFTVTKNKKGYPITPINYVPVAIKCSITVDDSFVDFNLSDECADMDVAIDNASQMFVQYLTDVLSEYKKCRIAERPIVSFGNIVNVSCFPMTPAVQPKFGYGIEWLRNNYVQDFMYLGIDNDMHFLLKSGSATFASKLDDCISSEYNDDNSMRRLAACMYDIVADLYPEAKHVGLEYLDNSISKNIIFYTMLSAVYVGAKHADMLHDILRHRYTQVVSQNAICEFAGSKASSALTLGNYGSTDDHTIGLFEIAGPRYSSGCVRYEYGIDISDAHQLKIIRTLETDSVTKINGVYEILGAIMLYRSSSTEMHLVYRPIADITNSRAILTATIGGSIKLDDNTTPDPIALGEPPFCLIRRVWSNIVGEIHGIRPYAIYDMLQYYCTPTDNALKMFIAALDEFAKSDGSETESPKTLEAKP